MLPAQLDALPLTCLLRPRRSSFGRDIVFATRPSAMIVELAALVTPCGDLLIRWEVLALVHIAGMPSCNSASDGLASTEPGAYRSATVTERWLAEHALGATLEAVRTTF